ncbi:MAG: MarC family protein [Gammaproteobacteria bacterium]
MNLYTATITLILVMDPLGNIPVFISVLNSVEPNRRNAIILRESIIAFLILLTFMFTGQFILQNLGITEPALGIAGGIILFLIALRMIFPLPNQQNERQIGEPFIVPLAVPLIAGPSALATVLLFVTQYPEHIFTWILALIIAAAVATTVLLFCSPLRKLLGAKGLIAIERLMGMILTTVAVQMFLTGIGDYFKLSN